MRSFASRKAIHNRIQARQNDIPAAPAVVPRQDTSWSFYFPTAAGITRTAPKATMPTATALIIDSSVVQTYNPATLRLLTSTSSSSTPSADTNLSTVTETATASIALTTLSPAEKVYEGAANVALHSLPPAVIGIASGGSALIILLALYCFICRWYYRRLPRSTKRWDVDDRAKKEVIYGDKPQFSPEDDRRGVPVGDSYFPQGETWQKFEGRTAHHPESFIYTGQGLPPGMGPQSPESPTGNRAPKSSSDFARPRPRFAENPRRGQIESVFSNVSFPTTHRADSIRHSFYPEGYEHDGEVWDFAGPGINNEVARPSFDSAVRRSINRASIFGEASSRGRGSVVVYDAYPMPPSPAEDPFASPGERHSTSTSGADRFVGKKSFDSHHVRPARDVRTLGTLAEDADESTSQARTTMSSSTTRVFRRA